MNSSMTSHFILSMSAFYFSFLTPDILVLFAFSRPRPFFLQIFRYTAVSLIVSRYIVMSRRDPDSASKQPHPY
jgi:hypothetical protein